MRPPNISGWLANKIVNYQGIKEGGKRVEKLTEINSTIQKIAIVIAALGLAAIGLGIAAIYVMTLPFHWPVSLLVGGSILGILGTYTATASENGELLIGGNKSFPDTRPWYTKFAEWLGIPTTPNYG